jgi:hypothetical protein
MRFGSVAFFLALLFFYLAWLHRGVIGNESILIRYGQKKKDANHT